MPVNRVNIPDTSTVAIPPPMRAADPSGTARAPLTIAAVAQLTGISEHTLRAWERRYGIPTPRRSLCRYRLYDTRDLEVIEAMRRLMLRGIRPAAAAELARQEVDRCAGSDDAPCMANALVEALTAMDSAAASAVFDRATATFNPCRVIGDVVRPALHEIGTLWEAGTIGVEGEHFASALVRSRLEVLGATTQPAAGPQAILACAPGERHETAILCLRVQLAHHGWRSQTFGGDLPAQCLADAVGRMRPALVAISVTRHCRFEAAVDAAQRVSASYPCDVIVGGQGARGRQLPTPLLNEEAFWGILDAAPIAAH